MGSNEPPAAPERVPELDPEIARLRQALESLRPEKHYIEQCPDVTGCCRCEYVRNQARIDVALDPSLSYHERLRYWREQVVLTCYRVFVEHVTVMEQGTGLTDEDPIVRWMSSQALQLRRAHLDILVANNQNLLPPSE